jgi:hypothetical protein
MAGKTEEAIVASCFTRDDAWLAQQNLDYFNGTDFWDHVRSRRSALDYQGATIAGGRQKGDQAELMVALKRVRAGDQGEPETVENWKGRVFLRRSGGTWGFASAQLEQIYN